MPSALDLVPDFVLPAPTPACPPAPDSAAFESDSVPERLDFDPESAQNQKGLGLPSLFGPQELADLTYPIKGPLDKGAPRARQTPEEGARATPWGRVKPPGERDTGLPYAIEQLLGWIALSTPF